MRIPLTLLALVLASAALADILPTPDKGPPIGSAGGLDFQVESALYMMGPPGRQYSKQEQIVVLTGCTEGRRNCSLAKRKNLIGMQVESVDGAYLRPENGMIQQIIDAFARKGAGPAVTLEFSARDGGQTAQSVAFRRER